MAPTYGLAEQAANLIRSQYNNPVLPSNSNPTTTGPPQPQSPTATSKSGASRVHLPSLTSFAIVIGLVLFRFV